MMSNMTNLQRECFAHVQEAMNYICVLCLGAMGPVQPRFPFQRLLIMFFDAFQSCVIAKVDHWRINKAPSGDDFSLATGG